MKIKLCFCFILLSCLSLRAGTSDQDKAFIDKYKTAFEAKDMATLESFLYTKGADPMALDFYRMMMSNEAGGKITKIELVDLTPDEIRKADTLQNGPNGVAVKLTLSPVKKLKITMEAKSADGSSSSSSQNFIALKDGKYVIPVPGPVK